MNGYFTKGELALWGGSAGAILLAFALFDREGWLTLAASLIGVTSLIFSAKGNPFGQVLMVVFSLLYGAISWSFAYYGEMVTYLGMTMPMAVVALVSWLPGKTPRISRWWCALPLFLSMTFTALSAGGACAGDRWDRLAHFPKICYDI